MECRICGKKFYPEKLRLHRKYFCGEFAQRTEAQSKTEKKKGRPGGSSTSNKGGKKYSVDSSENDSEYEETESEDEIAKQKKMNKLNAKSKDNKVKNILGKRKASITPTKGKKHKEEPST